jgi:hypothetical protein
MLLVDANVLLYAVDADSAEHDAALGWLDGALDGPEAVGWAWHVLLAFLRVSTRSGIFPSPLAPADALTQVQAWLDAPGGVVAAPTGRHLGLLSGLLRSSGTAGNLVSDAHLAALALEHDATVVSYDRDFTRFDGVRWRLPG